MMGVFYGMASGHAHRYQCRGDGAHVVAGLGIGIGGVKVDRAVADALLDAVSGRAVEVALLAAEWPDRNVAVALNRMRCRTPDGETWTAVRVRGLRERLGLPEGDPAARGDATISAGPAAHRLGIRVGSVHWLIREGILPASQVMHSAPWQIPLAAPASEAVLAGVQA